MNEITEIVIIDKVNAVDVFKSCDQIEDIISKVEREVLSFIPDTSTAKGRKEISSLAYKVSQSKSYLDGLGKDLVSELKEIPKLIDANRKTVRDRFDALRDKARQPLTNWEAEQEQIKAEKQMLKWHEEAIEMNEEYNKYALERFESDHEIALLLNDKFDRDIAEAKAEKERKQKEQEEELKRLAVEKVKREAEENAKREREAAESREAALKAHAERLEREAKEVIAQAEKQRVEAEKRANIEKQEAIENERRAAAKAEAERAAEQKRITDETARREADINHRKTIGTEIVKSLTENTSITREQAIEILIKLKDGLIPHTRITY